MLVRKNAVAPDAKGVRSAGVDEGFDPVEKEDSTDPPGVGLRGGVEANERAPHCRRHWSLSARTYYSSIQKYYLGNSAQCFAAGISQTSPVLPLLWDNRDVPLVFSQILRLQRTLIHKIEVEITTGRELQRNLTSMRELLVVELKRTSSSTERIEIQQRISRIDILLTQVRTRTDETELRFREFLQRVSTGQIRTETESQTLLQAIWSGYHKSLRSLVRHCAGYLTSIVRGVTGALANLGMGILDFYRLKFQPLELAIDALTGKGSFHKPISGIIGRR
ncbi:uncharacterized protein LOC119406463 [Rhipicephalus sanguineus]|uniref:uncharacterized protein LOC119406463 n=1 Tax=Rhipicephalus sanguineus TaxID=34632 RepID=UPI001895848C|nr:uncharacterized protein LOC119406463 [Rhipicephalus sanguineus]